MEEGMVSGRMGACISLLVFGPTPAFQRPFVHKNRVLDGGERVQLFDDLKRVLTALTCRDRRDSQPVMESPHTRAQAVYLERINKHAVSPYPLIFRAFRKAYSCSLIEPMFRGLNGGQHDDCSEPHANPKFPWHSLSVLTC